MRSGGALRRVHKYSAPYGEAYRGAIGVLSVGNGATVDERVVARARIFVVRTELLNIVSYTVLYRKFRTMAGG